MTVTVSRTDLKAHFMESEEKPFAPLDSYLSDETCLLPVLPFLRAVWLSALDMPNNPAKCNDEEFMSTDDRSGSADKERSNVV